MVLGDYHPSTNDGDEDIERMKFIERSIRLEVRVEGVHELIAFLAFIVTTAWFKSTPIPEVSQICT